MENQDQAESCLAYFGWDYSLLVDEMSRVGKLTIIENLCKSAGGSLC